jgi:hypothetical protein
MSLPNEPRVEGDERLHCSHIYHFARIRGKGSDYVFPLYELSAKIAHESRRFFPSLSRMATYLDCHQNQLYNAAKLLVGAGWWTVLETKLGKPVQYSFLKHDEWVAANPRRAEKECCKKLTMPWDDEPQVAFGKKLYGVTGGCEFFPSIIKGWLKVAAEVGASEEQMLDRAAAFMLTPDGATNSAGRKGSGWRKRLGSYMLGPPPKPAPGEVDIDELL